MTRILTIDFENFETFRMLLKMIQLSQPLKPAQLTFLRMTPTSTNGLHLSRIFGSALRGCANLLCRLLCLLHHCHHHRLPHRGDVLVLGAMVGYGVRAPTSVPLT